MLSLPIDLTMDLALGRPALAVVVGAPTSLIVLMRMVPTMTSTRRHFSTLSWPPISLCSSNLARILRLRTRPFLFCNKRSRLNITNVRRRRPFVTTKAQVDLDFAFILVISAIYSTPMSFLTSMSWTINDTITT